MENVLNLCGDIAAEPTASHESHGAVFYTFPLRVLRLSGTEDLPNVIAPEAMLKRFTAGDRVRIFGQIRSYSRRTETGNRLLISAWARSVEAAAGEPYDNRVSLTGTVARPPIYRCTPYGREITDVMLACERPIPPQTVQDGASRPKPRCDYIPCVTWGSVARLCAGFDPHTRVSFTGRFQSRPYTKIVDDIPTERIAYEVSVAEMRS